MHEASLARGILAAALARAAAGDRILAVRGWLAETEALDPGSLELHFAGAAQGTAAEGARLELRITHVGARCQACGERYLPEHHVTLCPGCGSLDGELLDRTGLGIDEIDVRRGRA